MKKIGRPPRMADILKVKDLRKKGLTFRDIMKVMDKTDVKTIYRWNKYVVGKTVDK